MSTPSEEYTSLLRIETLAWDEQDARAQTKSLASMSFWLSDLTIRAIVIAPHVPSHNMRSAGNSIR